MSEQQPSYDVEITIRAGRPFRVTDVSGKRAQEIIQSMYAAWGIGEPRSLADRPGSTFADRLAETGTYHHAEADAVSSVRRHATP
jgi:hypothetical protein